MEEGVREDTTRCQVENAGTYLPVRESSVDSIGAVSVDIVLQVVADHPLVFGLSMQKRAEPKGVNETPAQRVEPVERERHAWSAAWQEMRHEPVKDGDKEEEISASERVEVAEDNGIVLEELVMQIMQVINLLGPTPARHARVFASASLSLLRLCVQAAVVLVYAKVVFACRGLRRTV